MKTAFLLALTTAAVGGAQTSVVLPPAFDRTWGSGSSSALGGSSTRTQMVFAAPFSTGTSVLGFGLRPTTTTVDRPSFAADVEVRVSSTANQPGSLSATFASNVGSDVVVALPRQMVAIPAMPANRSTGSFARLLFGSPFVFGTNGNTNLNIDLFVYGRSAGAQWTTDRCFGTANGSAAIAGTGCGSARIDSVSVGGNYVAGATLSVTILNAPANVTALLFPSLDQKEIAPGFPLPFPLSTFGGAPGCDLLVNPGLGAVATTTNGVGTAVLSASIAVSSCGTGWQWVYQVPPTAIHPLGLATTASRKIRIGPEACSAIGQYVWHLTNVNAATGDNTTDSVPVVELLLP
jgi:hypothetical protein